MENYTTEYLIMHEDDIDWGALSRNPDRTFSLVEVRLFRKRIDWLPYLTLHKNSLTTNILEIGSKYFTPAVYRYLNHSTIATEEFVLNHRDNFDIIKFILLNTPSEEFLLSVIDCWKDEDPVKESLKRRIDLTSPDYNNIRLLFEIE